MVTILLVFCIFILFILSVYLFSKAEQEARLRRQRDLYQSLDQEAVLITTIQQGKVQETWCYINDIRSQFKQANVTMKNTPATIDGFFNK
ncbi:hypothetical protein [Tunicatimonas pelagia]|uniref:hypothetical protein n=1 Tax=Tunicatimonas pelagia TaxID=931531 RepID=UPI002666139B|nr:hypothetical protein [Tunicatimonas pelagia]WKN43998.1 hypothetical protein P0M28_03300 [Tunicatimonas pelagia]